MDKQCDGCDFLQNIDPKRQILSTEYWSAGLGNDQAYLGRAFVTLREHKGSLSELSDEEWRDYESLVRKLEIAYKEAFGAEPLNWGCYMNHAFKKEPFNPHVHWHIYPRYHTAQVIEGITFEDPLFGSFYDEKAERKVSDEVVYAIADMLRQKIQS